MSYATPADFLLALEGDAGLRSKIVLPPFSGPDAKTAFLQARADGASAWLDGYLANHYEVPINTEIHMAVAPRLRDLCIGLMCKLISPAFDVSATDFGVPYSALDSQLSRLVGALTLDASGNPKRYPPLEILPGVPRIA